MDLVPADVLVLILRHHPLGFVACVCRLVCKYWCAVISKERAHLFWRRPSYVEFGKELHLPAYYRTLLADGTWTIDFALKANHLLSASNRVQQLFILQKGGIIETVDRGMWIRDLHVSTHILIALLEGLIRVDHCVSPDGAQNIGIVDPFDRTAGRMFVALREKLVTLEELHWIPTQNLLRLFDKTRFGLEALREGFITPEIIAQRFVCPECMACCTSKGALQAMREDWFPWEYYRTKKIPCHRISRVFNTDNALAEALQDGLLGWAEIAALETLSVGDLIDRPVAIRGVREAFFTLAELDAMLDYSIFEKVFEHHAVLALFRDGDITIEEVVQLTSVKDAESFLRVRLRKKLKLV